MGEEAIKAELDEPDDPSASLVALDPNSGAVMVMIGGREYKTQQYNMATQGHRQAGSAFKTFVLSAAVDSGVSPDQYFDSDSPASFEVTGAADWKVSNYEGSGDGYISLTDATERSVNVAYANVMMKVGVDRVIQTAKAMGITAPLNRDPAIALGGLREGVNTLEMASAYGTLATGGMRATPYTIERIIDAEGEVVPLKGTLKRPAKRRALLQAVAALVTDTLEGVIDSGTGTRADIGRPQAGKTGTAQNYVDAWFVGYVPQMSAAVWVGHPKSQVPMRDVHGMRVTGGSFPAKIWARFMEKAMEGMKELDFPKPPDGSIVYETIDPVTGYLASKYCPNTVEARYAKGKAPKTRCPVHEELLVPNVEGMTLEKAQDTLKDAGLESSATVVPSGSPKGQVVDQDPEGGAKAERGLVVKLKVSDGKGVTTPGATSTAVSVPGVTGLTLSAAEAALSKLGLKWSITYVKSSKPRDTVIGSDPPAGTTVKPGSTVLLMVSGAKSVSTVPNVIGLTQGAATSRLEGLGFDVVVETASRQESKGKPKGTVVRQSPSAGATAPQGSSVVIYIARP
jgi:membrane peptidoglycan carboxypeptidase